MKNSKILLLANNSDLDGIVCSPQELTTLKDFQEVVVPGIRNTLQMMIRLEFYLQVAHNSADLTDYSGIQSTEALKDLMKFTNLIKN